jgi:hypothetical protein
MGGTAIPSGQEMLNENVARAFRAYARATMMQICAGTAQRPDANLALREVTPWSARSRSPSA